MFSFSSDSNLTGYCKILLTAVVFLLAVATVSGNLKITDQNIYSDGDHFWHQGNFLKSNYLSLDGSSPMKGNLDVGGNNVSAVDFLTFGNDRNLTIHDESTGEAAMIFHQNGSVEVANRDFNVKTKTIEINDTSVDLGHRIGNITQKYRNTRVKLNHESSFTWENEVRVPKDHHLSIKGEGYQNGANNITVNITINRNNTDEISGDPHRDPSRLNVGSDAEVFIQGVRFKEDVNADLPLTPKNCQGGALFNVGGRDATLEFQQLKGTFTENVLSFGNEQYGRIRTGHTDIYKQSDSVRNISAVTYYDGWCFAGGGGVVSHSHTNLGNGVSYDVNPRIKYLDGQGFAATPSGDLDMNGNEVKDTTVRDQADRWYSQAKTDSNQVINESSEKITDLSTSYSAPYKHDLHITGGLTGTTCCSNSVFNQHYNILVDGNKVAMPDQHGVDGWNYNAFNRLVKGLSSGSHDIEVVGKNQAGDWEVVSGSRYTYIQAEVIPR